MNKRAAEGVLLTGVYGSGKSSVAEEIAYVLEQRGDDIVATGIEV